MSYDLILQSDPDRVGPDLLAQLESLVASSSVLAGCELSQGGNEPVGDLEALEEAFQEQEASRSDFAEFCLSRRLDPGSDDAANRYLEKLWGRSLLTVYLPGDPPLVTRAFAELRRIAATLDLQLHDPQAGVNIESSYPGLLPPHF